MLATVAISRASGTFRKYYESKDNQLTNVAIPSDPTTSKRAIGTWDDAYTKATAALAKLSQTDKIGIVTGVRRVYL